ncbi:unnamed protein product, partial [Ectocarpus fasciculatus]
CYLSLEIFLFVCIGPTSTAQVHSGRKLEWLYHLGHGEMVTHCFDKTYRIYSSTFQMGLLHQVLW